MKHCAIAKSRIERIQWEKEHSMSPQERDQARYTMLAELNERNKALSRLLEMTPYFINLVTIDRDNQISRELGGSPSFTDLSHEEQIVVDIMALVRASKLPHQAVLDAATARLDREDSARKSHKIFPQRVPLEAS